MTALAEPMLNGEELATKRQPASEATASALSRSDVGEPVGVRITRFAALTITVAIAAASFVLSFSSLWNLAARSAAAARILRQIALGT